MDTVVNSPKEVKSGRECNYQHLCTKDNIRKEIRATGPF